LFKTPLVLIVDVVTVIEIGSETVVF